MQEYRARPGFLLMVHLLVLLVLLAFCYFSLFFLSFFSRFITEKSKETRRSSKKDLYFNKYDIFTKVFSKKQKAPNYRPSILFSENDF